MPVTVCSHGVGAPGAAIAFEELIAAGAKRLLRVGTCGGLQPQVQDGHLVIATAAVQQTGYGRETTAARLPGRGRSGNGAGPAPGCRRPSQTWHSGIVITRDNFYPGVPTIHTADYQVMSQANVLAVEMECAALFIVGSLRGVPTGAILAVDGNVLAKKESMDAYDPHRDVVKKPLRPKLRSRWRRCVNCRMFEATERRPVIGHLLDERQPADTAAVYFAYYHGEERTWLVTSPPEAERAEGYILLAQTGMDLFRPFLTLRLPPDMEQATKLIYDALRPETAVILNTPDQYMPLIRACFAIESEEQLQMMVLDPAHFEPVVNVLVTQEIGIGGRPRFVIRHRAEDNQVLAVASVNWQTPHFADVSVNTQANAQRQGIRP
jgi:uridine phosphorylase